MSKTPSMKGETRFGEKRQAFTCFFPRPAVMLVLVTLLVNGSACTFGEGKPITSSTGHTKSNARSGVFRGYKGAYCESKPNTKTIRYTYKVTPTIYIQGDSMYRKQQCEGRYYLPSLWPLDVCDDCFDKVRDSKQYRKEWLDKSNGGVTGFLWTEYQNRENQNREKLTRNCLAILTADAHCESHMGCKYFYQKRATRTHKLLKGKLFKKDQKVRVKEILDDNVTFYLLKDGTNQSCVGSLKKEQLKAKLDWCGYRTAGDIPHGWKHVTLDSANALRHGQVPLGAQMQ